MKKILSMVLVLSIMLGAFVISVSAGDEALTDAQKSLLKIQLIDANGDGAYAADDAAEFLKAAAGIIADDDKYDLDFDGTVSVADAQQAFRIVSGVAPVLNEAETLALFNEKVNSVKTVRPGFQKTETIQCPSVKVTTTGAPLSSLNVSNMEFNQYVDKIVNLVGSFMDSSQLNEMKQQAKDIYLPQTATKTVAARSNSHYSYFPVNNLGWSSKLTVDDISGATFKVEGSNVVCTITLGEYTYVGDEYPTGSSGFSKRQSLPYGKVFNVPSLDESDGSTVNKVQFKNGKVVLKADLATGDVLSVDYSYTYICTIKAAPQEDSSMVMTTATTANITDNYVMNRVTVN